MKKIVLIVLALLLTQCSSPSTQENQVSLASEPSLQKLSFTDVDHRFFYSLSYDPAEAHYQVSKEEGAHFILNNGAQVQSFSEGVVLAGQEASLGKRNFLFSEEQEGECLVEYRVFSVGEGALGFRAESCGVEADSAHRFLDDLILSLTIDAL